MRLFLRYVWIGLAVPTFARKGFGSNGSSSALLTEVSFTSITMCGAQQPANPQIILAQLGCVRYRTIVQGQSQPWDAPSQGGRLTPFFPRGYLNALSPIL